MTEQKMKPISIRLDHLKEGVSCHRYAAKGELIHTVYIEKRAFAPGQKPPSQIMLTVYEPE